MAATDHSDDLAGFSNYGAKSVDLGAPGVRILSTVPGGYSMYSDTSMAAPHVAGVAALLKSDDPGLDDAELTSRILESTDGVASLSNLSVTGSRLNAATMFEAETASSTELMLDAGRSRLVFGQGTALSGRLTDGAGAAVANKEVVLERREVGAPAFNAFSRVTTASDSSYRLAGVNPEKHTNYRARFADDDQGFAASSSASKRVSVRVRVANNTPQKNLKLGNRRAIAGAVSPSHAGSAVRITIKRNGEVINRRTVALHQYSRYRTTIKPGRLGRYAVFAVFPKDSDHLGNRSPIRAFKVVR